MGAGMHGFHGARLGQQHRFAEAVSAQHGDGIGGHAVDRSAAHGQFGTLVDIAVHLRHLVRRQAVDEFINREARLPVEPRLCITRFFGKISFTRGSIRTFHARRCSSGVSTAFISFHSSQPKTAGWSP